jgi:tripartite-type tricarboxylate transporter receptor subunit TctC
MTFRRKVMRLWSQCFALLVLLAIIAPAKAQDYPARPIRVIASQGPGGLSDIWMRALGEELGRALGQSIVVEDRTGAAGTIGARACAEAPPDGYTICILPDEAILINPIISPIAGFDPSKGLAPITKAFTLTQVFAVNASLHVSSFEDLAAAARARPKTLSYMAATLSKVAFMEEFNREHGTDFVRVPFKGGGDAVNSMLTGTTAIAIFGIGNLIQFIRNGQIVALAVDGDARSPLAPGIPTFRETGYTKHLMAAFFGIYAPAGTPAPIVAKLNRAIVEIASKPQFQERHMISRGLAPVLNSADAFAKELEADRAEGLAVVKASGLYPEIK